MEVLKLTRTYTDDFGTFGEIDLNGTIYTSAELPWRDNARGKSCIPVGSYRAMWTFSPKFERETYEVVPVEGRTAIRIHPANFVGDEDLGLRAEVDGCIAFGTDIGEIAGQKAVVNSKFAVGKLESHFGGEDFTLEIVEKYSQAKAKETLMSMKDRIKSNKVKGGLIAIVVTLLGLGYFVLTGEEMPEGMSQGISDTVEGIVIDEAPAEGN